MLKLRPLLRSRSTVVLAALALTAACRSSSSQAATPERTGVPARVVYMNYGAAPGGQRLEIVNQSHTDRTELYSRARPIEEATTKVTTDEVMDEVIQFFRTKGFFDKAHSGAAPVTGEGQVSQALEIDTPERHVFLSIHKGMPAAERQVFLECAQAFVLIYNNTYQLQSVDRPPDWDKSRGASRPSEGLAPQKSGSR